MQRLEGQQSLVNEEPEQNRSELQPDDITPDVTINSNENGHSEQSPVSEPSSLEPSDHDLLDRFIRGNERSFMLFYNRYASQVYNLAARVMPSLTQAEDLVAQTFVDAYYALRQMEPNELPKKLMFWLDTIFSSAALNKLIHDPSAVYSWESPDKGEPVTTIPPTFAAEQRIWMVLRTLSPRQRFILALRDYQQLPYTTIEMITSLTHHQIEAILLEARRRLYAGVSGENMQTELSECSGALLVQADLDSQLTPENGVWAENHLRNCPNCRLLLTELRHARDIYHGLPVLMVPTALGQRVQTQLDSLRAVLPPRTDSTLTQSNQEQVNLPVARSPRDTGPLPETLAERARASDDQAIMVGAAPPKVPQFDENDHLLLPAWWKKSYEPRTIISPRLLAFLLAVLVIALFGYIVSRLNIPLNFQSPLALGGVTTQTPVVGSALATTPDASGANTASTVLTTSTATPQTSPTVIPTQAPTPTIAPTPTAIASHAPTGPAIVVMGDDYGNQEQNLLLPVLASKPGEKVETMTVADLGRYLGPDYVGSLKTIAAAARLAPVSPGTGIHVHNSKVQHVGAGVYIAVLLQLGIRDADFSLTSLQDIQGSAGMLAILKGYESWAGHSVTSTEQRMVTETLTIDDTLINAGIAPDQASGIILNTTTQALQSAPRTGNETQRLNWAETTAGKLLDPIQIANKQSLLQDLTRYTAFVATNVPSETSAWQSKTSTLEEAEIIPQKQ